MNGNIKEKMAPGGTCRKEEKCPGAVADEESAIIKSQSIRSMQAALIKACLHLFERRHVCGR